MGPLTGVKVTEIGGLAPANFCAMMLADMGAEIVRVDRKDRTPGYVDRKYALLLRGRRSISLDLKKSESIEVVLKLVEQSDAILEGFRPGVMEHLGLGPDVCFERNPKIVYGRLTGWGQEGPLALAAGHDINYIALTGVLHAIGRPGEKPVPPLNLVGDLGGGGMLMAFGLVCALHEAQISGRGQVVDAAMVDGAAILMSMIYGFRAAGRWTDKRGTNVADGGAPFYDTYETADGKWVSVGSIEPKFYELLLKHAGIDDPEFRDQMDCSNWPKLKEKIAKAFRTKTRDEWCEIMEATDVCFAPVLSLDEAPKHPHNVVRQTFIPIDGILQPAPAPRFSRTQPRIQAPPPAPGEHTDAVLRDLGFSADQINGLKTTGVI